MFLPHHQYLGHCHNTKPSVKFRTCDECQVFGYDTNISNCVYKQVKSRLNLVTLEINHFRVFLYFRSFYLSYVFMALKFGEMVRTVNCQPI